MADTYIPGLSGYAHNGQTGDSDEQTSQLYQALLKQSMQQGNGNTNAFSPVMQGLATYMMMNGMPGQGGATVNPGTMGGMAGAGANGSMGTVGLPASMWNP